MPPRHPFLRCLPLLLVALPVWLVLAGTIHASLTSPVKQAAHLALQHAAPTTPGQRSTAHLPFFSFVRALRPRS